SVSDLWQPHHNPCYSPSQGVPKRLTLPANWGQILRRSGREAGPVRAGLPGGVEFMRCALRPSQAGETGARRSVLAAIAVAFALAIGAVSSAEAQIFPSPQPTPTPGITIISSDISAGQAVTNLGSNFLERLANQATNGVDRIGRANPGGGGASQAAEAPKFRAWLEGYGMWSKTDVQGDFAGDTRVTQGGVAGIGATVAPGVNLGFSVDRSHSKIDVPLA